MSHPTRPPGPAQALVSALVYFSSVSENTHRFVQRVDPAAQRIPLRRPEGALAMDRPYVLITPTYGSGDPRASVPRQVARFLNDPTNRALLRGVVSSGNTNFGSAFCLAGRVIAARCSVPLLHRFELLGTSEDVSIVRQSLSELWTECDLAVAA